MIHKGAARGAPRVWLSQTTCRSGRRCTGGPVGDLVRDRAVLEHPLIPVRRGSTARARRRSRRHVDRDDRQGQDRLRRVGMSSLSGITGRQRTSRNSIVFDNEKPGVAALDRERAARAPRRRARAAGCASRAGGASGVCAGRTARPGDRSRPAPAPRLRTRRSGRRAAAPRRCRRARCAWRAAAPSAPARVVALGRREVALRRARPARRSARPWPRRSVWLRAGPGKSGPRDQRARAKS